MKDKKQSSGDGSQQQISGDNSNLTQIIHYNSPKNTLDVLQEKFLEQQKNEAHEDAKELIAKLKSLMHQKSSGEFKGLYKKMEEGDREDEYEEAIELKEEIAKRIVRHQNFESAQKIYLYLLQDTITRFKHKIKPLIIAGADRLTVDGAVYDEIIHPITATLGENVLDMYSEDVKGLIHFLVGNCHLEWSKC